MIKYTVVLLYPDYMTGNFGQDVFVAHVEALDTDQAISSAQDKAFDANASACMDSHDFALVVMFGGWHEPELYGWEL